MHGRSSPGPGGQGETPLSASTTPIDVFTPVFDRAGHAIQEAIQARIDNPFPIVHGMIGKALADAQTLSAIADGFGRILTSIATGFPPALGVAFQKSSGGDFTGAVNAFAPVFMGPLFQGFAQYSSIVAFVKKQFDVAEQVAGQLTWAAWAMGPGMLGNVFTVVRAKSGTLDALAIAIPAGDLGGVVNALQHGAANLAIAAIGFVDGYRVAIDAYRTGIANILHPPPPEPEEPWEIAAIPDVTTPALSVAVAPATDTVGQGTAAATEAAAGTESATPTDPDAEVTTPEPVTTEPVTTEPLVRDSLVAVPGKSGLDGAATGHSTAAVSAASEKVSAASDASNTASTGASGDAE